MLAGWCHNEYLNETVQSLYVNTIMIICNFIRVFVIQ